MTRCDRFEVAAFEQLDSRSRVGFWGCPTRRVRLLTEAGFQCGEFVTESLLTLFLFELTLQRVGLAILAVESLPSLRDGLLTVNPLLQTIELRERRLAVDSVDDGVDFVRRRGPGQSRGQQRFLLLGLTNFVL